MRFDVLSSDLHRPLSPSQHRRGTANDLGHRRLDMDAKEAHVIRSVSLSSSKMMQREPWLSQREKNRPSGRDQLEYLIRRARQWTDCTRLNAHMA